MTVLDDRDEGPWSVAELIRDRGENDAVEVKDSIGRLERGGLIHRTTEGLVFPTRTAIYFEQIAEKAA